MSTSRWIWPTFARVRPNFGHPRLELSGIKICSKSKSPPTSWPISATSLADFGRRRPEFNRMSAKYDPNSTTLRRCGQLRTNFGKTSTMRTQYLRGLLSGTNILNASAQTTSTFATWKRGRERQPPRANPRVDTRGYQRFPHTHTGNIGRSCMLSVPQRTQPPAESTPSECPRPPLTQTPLRTSLWSRSASNSDRVASNMRKSKVESVCVELARKLPPSRDASTPHPRPQV